jgi:sortase A
MAHNYKSHFGRFTDLELDDTVIFTDVDGIVTCYQVVAKDILSPDSVEEMTAGAFDLTLFTCTYGGKSRVTIYCNKVDP